MVKIFMALAMLYVDDTLLNFWKKFDVKDRAGLMDDAFNLAR